MRRSKLETEWHSCIVNIYRFPECGFYMFLKHQRSLKNTSYYLYPQGRASFSAHIETTTRETIVCTTAFKLECVSCRFKRRQRFIARAEGKEV